MDKKTLSITRETRIGMTYELNTALKKADDLVFQSSQLISKAATDLRYRIEDIVKDFGLENESYETLKGYHTLERLLIDYPQDRLFKISPNWYCHTVNDVFYGVVKQLIEFAEMLEEVDTDD